jgi:hypothetical protein
MTSCSKDRKDLTNFVKDYLLIVSVKFHQNQSGEEGDILMAFVLKAERLQMSQNISRKSILRNLRKIKTFKIQVTFYMLRFKTDLQYFITIFLLPY